MRSVYHSLAIIGCAVVCKYGRRMRLAMELPSRSVYTLSFVCLGRCAALDGSSKVPFKAATDAPSKLIPRRPSPSCYHHKHGTSRLDDCCCTPSQGSRRRRWCARVTLSRRGCRNAARTGSRRRTCTHPITVLGIAQRHDTSSCSTVTLTIGSERTLRISAPHDSRH